jgi:hypothetical protein
VYHSDAVPLLLPLLLRNAFRLLSGCNPSSFFLQK